MSTLEIRYLHVSVAGQAGESREILRGVDLTVAAGQTHAIMGPNGSGKSTLAYSIAGHPRYQVTSGSVTLDGDIPAARVHGLRPQLPALNRGEGVVEVSFDRYDPVTGPAQDQG